MLSDLRLEYQDKAGLAEIRRKNAEDFGIALDAYDHQVVALEMMLEKERCPPLRGACTAVAPSLYYDNFTGSLHVGESDPMGDFRGGAHP